MAAFSAIALLDDITAILDDVAVLSKVAAKKTAGVLGDDLALNAQQLTGVASARELPVVWAVAKGSLLNKLILVPAALVISAFAPWAVTPLLMLGGAFLCFEGAEKLLHKFFRDKEAVRADHREKIKRAAADPKVDLVTLEKEKIKGAVRTDFILSAEIIAIALGASAAAPLLTRSIVLSIVAVLITVFVYGLVATIVKLDDVGLALSERGGSLGKLGYGIVAAAPWLMKALSIAGTIAMFLVGGGILVHGVPALQRAVAGLSTAAGERLAWLLETLLNGGVGLLAGALLVLIWSGVERLRS
ncbi:MAG: DUF808 domain-containing protein [Burkholderiales bacterium]